MSNGSKRKRWLVPMAKPEKLLRLLLLSSSRVKRNTIRVMQTPHQVHMGDHATYGVSGEDP